MGDPKIPGIILKNYLKYLYKFETLVPFEVLPLPLDAAIPAPFPALGALPDHTNYRNIVNYECLLLFNNKTNSHFFLVESSESRVPAEVSLFDSL